MRKAVMAMVCAGVFLLGVPSLSHAEVTGHASAKGNIKGTKKVHGKKLRKGHLKKSKKLHTKKKEPAVVKD